MSSTKRRVRHLKSTSTRAALNRRSAGARAAKATSTQATAPVEPSDASVRAGARFIVIERTESDLREQETELACPFAVVEAETRQTPENFFGRSWQGYHATRESAQAEAQELNALAGQFLASTEPVIAPTKAEPTMPAPMGVPGPVLGDKPTAWAAELLAPTQEMPAVTDDDPDPLELPGTTTLRAAVGEITHRPEPAVPPELSGPVETAEARDAAAFDARISAGNRRLLPGDDDRAARTTQLPRISDAMHAGPAEGISSPVIPGLRRAAIHEIRHGEQVACTDGSWRTTAGGSLRDGVAVLVMEDLTEHVFHDTTLRFWVRTAPTATALAGLHRPPCPNGCFRTQADFQLCTCNFGCGCAPHPASVLRRGDLVDTRELHLAGAVA